MLNVLIIAYFSFNSAKLNVILSSYNVSESWLLVFGCWFLVGYSNAIHISGKTITYSILKMITIDNKQLINSSFQLGIIM